MEKFSKLEQAVRDNLVNHINQRWRQLYELEKEWSDRAFRYLFLTNSGGAIAVLSFFGASDKALDFAMLKAALLLFALGVLFVGVATAKTYHRIAGLFKQYRNEADHFFNDKITWEYLTEEDTKRSKPTFWAYFFPYVSFACFIVGIVLGSLALFP
jgi:hypothetical protein